MEKNGYGEDGVTRQWIQQCDKNKGNLLRKERLKREKNIRKLQLSN